MADTVTGSINVSLAINVSYVWWQERIVRMMVRRRGEGDESLSVNVFHLMSLLLMFFVCVRKKHLHLKRGSVEGRGEGSRGVAGYMVSEQRFSLNDFYCSFVVNLLCN